MDSRSTQLLWDLRVALLKAIAESEDIRNALDRMREHGWSAYLLIDGAGEDHDAEAVPLSATQGERPPEFRINGDDLVLLRSLGIDPTRTLRRRPRG